MTTRTFDAFVFDLDGTLLHTLPDLIEVTNTTLAHFGYPARTYDEIQRMVGNGALSLIAQAVPDGTDSQTTVQVLDFWKQLYVNRDRDLTQPFDGIADVVARVREAGRKTGVLSNKFQAGVDEQISRYLPGLFDVVLGEGPVPRKPDPTGLREAAKRLGTTPERVAYFGDSEGDMRVAQAAGAFAVGVTWGYQSTERLVATGAQLLIDEPARILDLL